jgi:alpha-N-arabinofuranosidase
MDTQTYHVDGAGDDDATGSAEDPLPTVSAAAARAGPGDEVLVHEGVYRERVDPPRGGTGPDERVVYRAAPDERVVLTGSAVVEGWTSAGEGVWSVTLADDFFGEYNPFAERIRGDWFDDRGRDHHTGAVYCDGAPLREAADRAALRAADADPAWYAEAAEGETTVWAQFGQTDPADALVEVNARPAVFYPSSPGVDYVTVRGFELRHAATQWAPPTVEQIGLLGTHWSTGWVIADNEVSHSRCTGITLGKYGAGIDETGASADRYNDTIREALDEGWERGSVGHHVVRNNVVHDCEQAGIVGSMGAAFSEISGNHVYDVNVRRQFRGAEIAGIKFHGPIDATIRDNYVHHARRGIWLDWMTQGTRVTRNVLAANSTDDLFVEVNHGPFVVDTNVCLSGTSLFTMSQGGAYAHNLFAGDVARRTEPNRETPYHVPRSTEVAGLSAIEGGDARFYNNVFLGGTGLAPFDDAALPVQMGGNVFCGGAEPSVHEDAPTVVDADPAHTVAADVAGCSLTVAVDGAWAEAATELVTTDLLGRADRPDAPYTDPDGTPLCLDADWTGAPRDESGPTPGPFESPGTGRQTLALWPR